MGIQAALIRTNALAIDPTVDDLPSISIMYENGFFEEVSEFA
ncbi:hypothetical protein M7I_7287 [Glarea lozoyensis 74030]|uniref:Uncharacterized protein n=1 Tax=Glarea lozoyensis (strain ATCC 74030 / MF5533) TaxID=1104152 RepID=H0EWW2_GLAL7|nr:hypothetical protein M7I_7287 [Glarea lozoyensis 74030]